MFYVLTTLNFLLRFKWQITIAFMFFFHIQKMFHNILKHCGTLEHYGMDKSIVRNWIVIYVAFSVKKSCKSFI